MQLPNYRNWIGSPEWEAHVLRHHDQNIEDCAGCFVRPLLAQIHLACNDNMESAITAWKHQDGYGVEGFVPAQGWDWSGIRDSSPAAIKNIADALGIV